MRWRVYKENSVNVRRPMHGFKGKVLAVKQTGTVVSKSDIDHL